MARNPRKPRKARRRRNPSPPEKRLPKRATDQAKLAMVGATLPWCSSNVAGTLIVYPINPRAAVYASDARGTKDEEELAAIRGVEFGVLESFPQSDVVAFGTNVKKQPSNWPLPSKIVDKDANIVTMLVASGESNDLTAESIYPLGNNGWFENRSIASILFNALMFGTWCKGKWEAPILFVLPDKLMRSSEKGTEYDATGSKKLANYLCGKKGCPSPSFLQDLGEAVDWLREHLPRNKYKYLGFDFDDDRARDVLFLQLKNSLPEIRIGYQWATKKRERVPAEKYVGSDPFLRSLATDRRKIRQDFTKGDELIGLRDRLNDSSLLDEPDPFGEIYERQTDEESRAFLDYIRQAMTSTAELDEKEERQLEDKAFRKSADLASRGTMTRSGTVVKSKKKKGKRGLDFGPDSPLISFMFTLYWQDPEDSSGQYQIVVQSRSYSVAELGQMIKHVKANSPDADVYAPDKPDVKMVVSDAAALRAAVLNGMGVSRLNEEWAAIKKVPLRPKLLFAATTNYQRSVSRVKLGLPKPVQAQSGIGMYFGELYLDTVSRKGTIAPANFLSAWVEEGKATQVVPRTIPQSAGGVIGTELLGVTPTPTGKLRRVQPIPQLFKLSNIQKTSSYAYFVNAERDKRADKGLEPLSPEVEAERAYKKTVRGGMSGSFGGKGTPDKVRGGRRGYKAFSGRKLATSSRTERGRKEHLTSRFSARKSIFSFATALCKTKGVTCVSTMKTAERFDATDIEEAMIQYGVEGGAEDVDALKELRLKVENHLNQTFYVHSLEGVLVPGSDDDFISTELLAELALRNGRRPRKARKPRRPRRGRRNPRNLNTADTESLIQYATGRGTRAEREEEATKLDLAFRELAPPASDWKVSSQSVEDFFPRGPETAGNWRPTKRLRSAGGSNNLIASLDQKEPKRDRIFAEEQIERMPFMGAQSGKAFSQGAELSLREAMGMLQKQKEKRTSQLTMQASSALCMNGRTRKLSLYRLPLPTRGSDEAGVAPNRDAIIWVSPKGASPRVMSFRRGSHIDCDFTSDNVGDLPGLVGQAVQSAMYWLQERPAKNRGRHTTLWVGRVGETRLYNAWNAVMDNEKSFSVSSILNNLRDGGRSVSVLTSSQAKEDEKRYNEAVSKLFGIPTVRIEEGEFKPPPEATVEEQVLTLVDLPDEM